MSFDEIMFINQLLRKSIEDEITWTLEPNIPNILSLKSEASIISCYVSSETKSGRLYLFKYRIPEYYGEYDRFFNLEKVGLALVNGQQITWQNINDASPVYNLYEYVSNRYSGIQNIF